MNQSISRVVLIVFALFLASCASTPKTDPRVLTLKNKLESLQNNQELATRGGSALKRAVSAYDYVRVNFNRLTDDEQVYSLYAADKLIQLAEYAGRIKLAEDRSGDLLQEQQKLVLQARTLEAEKSQRLAKEAQLSAKEAQLSARQAQELRELALAEAKAAQNSRDSALREQQIALDAQKSAQDSRDMAVLEQQKALEAKREAQELRDSAVMDKEKAYKAQIEAQESRDMALKEQQAALAAQKDALAQAAVAKTEAEKSRLNALAEAEKAKAALAEAAAIKAEMESLKNQLSDLQAKQTERGLLITLGDVLFEFNKSDLKDGAARNLGSLVMALNDRTEQLVIVEGHTDSVGSNEYNLELSLKRANSVKDYLVSQGINESRISTEGLGPDHPVATNDTSDGRQRNRRVEIILPNLD